MRNCIKLAVDDFSHLDQRLPLIFFFFFWRNMLHWIFFLKSSTVLLIQVFFWKIFSCFNDDPLTLRTLLDMSACGSAGCEDPLIGGHSHRKQWSNTNRMMNAGCNTMELHSPSVVITQCTFDTMCQTLCDTTCWNIISLSIPLWFGPLFIHVHTYIHSFVSPCLAPHISNYSARTIQIRRVHF